MDDDLPHSESRTSKKLYFIIGLLIILILAFGIGLFLVTQKDTLFNRGLSGSDSVSTTEKDSPEVDLGDFPIHPFVTFVNMIPKEDCEIDPAALLPQSSPCFNDTYIFTVNDTFEDTFDWYRMNTQNGWECSGGAEEIVAESYSTGSGMVTCTKNGEQRFVSVESVEGALTLKILVPTDESQ